MDDDRTSGMFEALRLTRAGQLNEAFAVMQRSLGSATFPPPGATGTRPGLSGIPRPTAAASPFTVEDGAAGAGGLLGRFNGAISGKPGAGRSGILGGLLQNLPLVGGAWGRAGAAEAAAAPGGAIRHLSHTGPAGTRTDDLYIPTGRTGDRLPLVVMLHGASRTQSTAPPAPG
jgi:hypothetical protein